MDNLIKILVTLGCVASLVVFLWAGHLMNVNPYTDTIIHKTICVEYQRHYK